MKTYAYCLLRITINWITDCVHFSVLGLAALGIWKLFVSLYRKYIYLLSAINILSSVTYFSINTVHLFINTVHTIFADGMNHPKNPVAFLFRRSDYIARSPRPITLLPRQYKKLQKTKLGNPTMAYYIELSGRFVLKMLEILESLVGNKIPFVGYRKLPMRPFIRLERPFIRISGVTLIELMVTLAVVTILALVAVPNLRNFLENGRLITQTNDFISDVQMARSEAIKRAGIVIICPSTNGASCTTGWNNGRLVFVDVSNPNNFAYDAGVDTVIRYHDALPAGSVQSVTSAGFPSMLIFDSRGVPLNNLGVRLIDLPAPPLPLQIGICDVQNKVAGKMVAIGGSGQTTSDTLSLTCP